MRSCSFSFRTALWDPWQTRILDNVLVSENHPSRYFVNFIEKPQSSVMVRLIVAWWFLEIYCLLWCQQSQFLFLSSAPSSDTTKNLNSNDRCSKRMSSNILNCVWIQVRAWLNGIGMKCSLQHQEHRLRSMFSFQILSEPNKDGNELISWNLLYFPPDPLHFNLLRNHELVCMHVTGNWRSL